MPFFHGQHTLPHDAVGEATEPDCLLQHSHAATAQRTSSNMDTVCVALCSSCASFSSSRTAAPSAAYSFFRLSRVRVLLRVMAATACRNRTRSDSVLMSSHRLESGEILRRRMVQQ